MNINVDLNMIGKLLRHCVSVMYFRKNGKRMWQYMSHLRLKMVMIQVKGTLYEILLPRLVYPEN